MTGPQSFGELSRRAFVAAGALATGGVALSACSGPGTPEPAHTSRPSDTPTPMGSSAAPLDSWAPTPRTVDELRCVARQEGESLVLHTRSGQRQFWAGVTLGSAMPGRAPQRMSITAAEYRRWLPMMADLGIRVIRCTTIHPPHFYAELLRYNTENPDAPLYLIQGAELPSSLQGDLFGSANQAVEQMITDASAAVHGTLRRASTRGRVSGQWKADVSAWVAAWIIGPPLEPAVVKATDEGSGRTHRDGASTYFSATKEATPTEHWLAARMDQLATLEAAHGLSVPIGVENWPTTDPLVHPEEPVAREDLVSLDPNHIATSIAWPGGAFVAYAATPYAPDFLFQQPSYNTASDGDPYAAYLRDLATHHAGRPLLITQVGVPSSIGSARQAPHDRDLGDNSEQEAMEVNAELLRLYSSLGLAGGILASWSDDWSAQSWNTQARHEPAKEASATLWHDPLTAAQWFGLLAHDPARAGARTVYEGPSEMQRIDVDHDAAYLYLSFYFSRRVTSPVDIGFDLLPGYGLVLPGGGGKNVYDVAIQVIPTMSTATCFIRTALDPVRLDGLPAEFLPQPGSRGWSEQSLTVARPMKVPNTDRELPAQMQQVGILSLGSWDPKDPAFDSRATWSLERPDADEPAMLSFRLPWSLLALADPAAKVGLVPRGDAPTGVPVSVMKGLIESSTPGSPTEFSVEWDPWESVTFTERLKAGVEVLATAIEETSKAATTAPATASPSTS
ncbi:hypothetical protein [Gephyromycinifex aptenodytis]|uniref:hypothetical protein n=1 Tax=Gephyromycinifex aptenodytis TaxID=2716227 RepID=UPI001445C042|nr:hypothetical protein [Gephyromycinifex aptenodytis]